jgi:hypothetical protein
MGSFMDVFSSPGPLQGRPGSASLADNARCPSSPRHHSSPANHLRSISPAHLPTPPAASRRVWKTPSESDAIRVVKKVKLNPALGSRGRVTTHDFEDMGKAILKGAFGHFESRLCTEWPYPDEDQEMQWAQRAWSRASSDKGSDAELRPQALKLVSYMQLSTHLLAC